MPDGTEREAKERQGQNWPGKFKINDFAKNFCMSPEVIYFQQCLLIKHNLIR